MGIGKRLLVLCTVFTVFAAASYALGEEYLTIYYTSSLNGNLDGCDCKGQPRSGLVKTGYFLAGRERNGSILIEAGDFLDVKEDRLLAEYIFASYRELGYDVIGVGDQEFSNGIDAFLEYGEEHPLLCNNLSIRSGGRFQLFSPLPRIQETGGLTLGIFSVIDPDVFYFYPDEIRSNIIVEDPREAAEALVEELESARVDIIVGIYHGSLEAAEELAGSVSGIDVLLVGHEQRLLDAKQVGDTVVVSPGENGNRVGVLSLVVKRNTVQSFDNRFQCFEYKTAPDLPSIRKRIQDYYVQLTGRLRDNGEE